MLRRNTYHVARLVLHLLPVQCAQVVHVTGYLRVKAVERQIRVLCKLVHLSQIKIKNITSMVVTTKRAAE